MSYFIMYYFIPLSTITAISLYTLYPSFNLALFGDFWVTLWRYELMVGKLSIGVWNHFTYLHTLYGPQDILSGLLSKIFDYKSLPYYVVAYLLRLLASFSFYPITLHLTKSKLASFFASIFFSITPVGLETTNWVFNMTSYITVSMFNLFLYLYLKLRQSSNLKLLIPTFLLFYATMISSPIRTTSIAPLIIVIDFFWFFTNRTFPVLKKILLRLSIITLIFLFLLLGTNTYSSPNWDQQTIPTASYEVISTILNGVRRGFTLIQNGQSEFILYPVATIGGMLIPNFEGVFEIIFALIGGVLIILWLVLFIKYRKSHLAEVFIISLLWTLFPLLIPWIRDINLMFPTTHRYLIISVGGFSLFLAALISLSQGTKYKTVMLLLISVVTLIHLYSTSTYLNKLLTVRSQKLDDTIWSQVPKFSKEDFQKGALAFYFSGDNADVVHNVLTFGFPQRIQLIYGISDYRSVVTLASFEEVISAVSDGKSLIKHGLEEKPISIENIYTFYLKGNDKLVNTTVETQDKLSQLLKSKN